MMMSSKAQFRYFADPIYQIDVWTVRGPDEAVNLAMKRVWPKFGSDGHRFEHNGMMCFQEDGVRGARMFIVVSDDLKGRPLLATVAHECFHGCVRVMEHVGIDLVGQSEEAFAYYFDFLFEKSIKSLGVM